MKKAISFVFALLLICASTLFAEVGTDSTKLTLHGTVPRNSGVVVPTDVKLVGNFAIAYDYNNTGVFSYVSSDTVEVSALGSEMGNIVFRADYYGNEPEEYSCAVTFSSDGWGYKDKTAQSMYKLPINFSVPIVDETVKNYGLKVEASDTGAFRLTVPVNAPISGNTVVYVNASWDEDSNMPSGDYTADIMIEVQSLT